MDFKEGEIIINLFLSSKHSKNVSSRQLFILQNSCPLCQAPNLAEEMREFESEADFNRSASNSSENMYPDNVMGRIRRRMHRTVIGEGYSIFGTEGRPYSEDQRGFFGALF